VIKISLPYIYNLATELDPITKLQPDSKVFDVMYPLVSAHLGINSLLNNSVFASTLRSCRESATTLQTNLQHIMGKANENTTLSNYDVGVLNQQLEQFKIALLAEIGVLPAYFVNQKGGFDTLTLLDWGHLIFPTDLHAKVPEAVFDVEQAAKALAYELPTAAGFHTFRATESVLRRYYTHVSGGKPHPRVRNIGVYIKGLRAAHSGDEIVLSSLEQLTKLHRNPLIHPEVVLTLEEAISTLGMARSVVSAMLNALPPAPPTTASP